MRLGRIDDETTANVGMIEGGSAANVVPERCRARRRGAQPRRARAPSSSRREIVDLLADAANDPECECDLDVTLERHVRRLPRPRVERPRSRSPSGALRDCGYEPTPIVTGGGSDANVAARARLRVLNLANGTERNHEPSERVSADALEAMLEVAIALVDDGGGVAASGVASRRRLE